MRRVAQFNDYVICRDLCHALAFLNDNISVMVKSFDKFQLEFLWLPTAHHCQQNFFFTHTSINLLLEQGRAILLEHFSSVRHSDISTIFCVLSATTATNTSATTTHDNYLLYKSFTQVGGGEGVYDIVIIARTSFFEKSSQ